MAGMSYQLLSVGGVLMEIGGYARLGRAGTDDAARGGGGGGEGR